MSEAIQQRRRRLALSEVSRVVPGLYSWLAAVLVPVSQAGASWASRGAALVSLAALVLSFTLSGSRPRASRWLGVYVFLLASLAAWALLGSRLSSEQLDPVRSALGGVGFLLHALAWGAPPREPDEAAPDNLVPGSPLQPRHRPVRASPFVLGAGIVLALLPSAAAFGVERPGASLLAHTLAVGCGLLLVTASVDIALQVGKPREFAAWRTRATRSAWSLGGLTLAAGIGLIWLALR